MNCKNAWTVFLAALCAALPLRFFQMLMLVDVNTGFFTDGNITAVIISAILAVGVILIVLFCHRDRTFHPYRPMTGKAAAGTAILAGAAVAMQSVLALVQAANAGGIDRYEMTEADLPTGVQHPLLYAFLGILGIAAAVIILAEGIHFAKGTNLFENWPLLSLIPPLWGCLCLVVLFVKFTEVVNTTENIYDLFTAILLLLFYSFQSKFLSGVDSRRSRRNIFAFGLSASLVGLVTAVPNCLVPLLRSDMPSALPISVAVMNLLLCLYAIAFLLEIFKDADSGKMVSSQKVDEISKDIPQGN